MVIRIVVNIATVCVGFLNTLVWNCCVTLSTKTSKKGNCPCFSSSIVNLMLSLIELRCSRKPFSCSLPCLHITKVSSTYLSHIVGFLVVDLIARFSKYSI